MERFQFMILFTILAVVNCYEDYYGRNFETAEKQREDHIRNSEYSRSVPNSYYQNHDSRRENVDNSYRSSSSEPYNSRSSVYSENRESQDSYYHTSTTDSYRGYQDPYARTSQPYDQSRPEPGRGYTSYYDANEIRPHYDPYTTEYSPITQSQPNYDRYHPTQYDPYRERDEYTTTTSRSRDTTPPRITIPDQGTAVGAEGHTSWTGRTFYKFLGIKYAHVGKGDLRFQKPEPIRPWGGEFNATIEPPECPSFPNLNKILREERLHDLEDCLSVSIYTPNLQGRFPVMFYIHGEFFFDGTSKEAQPEYLLEKDVILVTVEYRLAPFGFLSTSTSRIPGNAAVTDVITALEWIQRNIRYFGGDSRKVTIFGQGAGASMAHLLSISPYVGTNLFQQVILQSGTALNPYLLTSDPVKHARDIARKAGCTADTLDDIADCLSRLSTGEVLRAFLKHCQSNEPQGVGNYGGFQFVINDYYNIIPRHPYKLASQYDGVNYLIMGGVTKEVGSFFYSKIFPYLQRSQKQDLDSLIDVVLKHTLGEQDEYGIWKNLIARELFSDEQRAMGTLWAYSPGLIDLVSAVLYKAPLLEALQQNAKFDPNGTYLYTFDYRGKHKRYRFAEFPFDLGVSLSDDNIYLFPYPDYVASLDEEDQEVANSMIDLWTSFATNGIPRSNKLRDWPQMHLVTGPYLNIDSRLDINDDFVEEFSASQITAAISQIYSGLTQISKMLSDDE